jgi:hypothetical protein
MLRRLGPCRLWQDPTEHNGHRLIPSDAEWFLGGEGSRAVDTCVARPKTRLTCSIARERRWRRAASCLRSSGYRCHRAVNGGKPSFTATSPSSAQRWSALPSEGKRRDLAILCARGDRRSFEAQWAREALAMLGVPIHDQIDGATRDATVPDDHLRSTIHSSVALRPLGS